MNNLSRNSPSPFAFDCTWWGGGGGGGASNSVALHHFLDSVSYDNNRCGCHNYDDAQLSMLDDFHGQQVMMYMILELSENKQKATYFSLNSFTSMGESCWEAPIPQSPL